MDLKHFDSDVILVDGLPFVVGIHDRNAIPMHLVFETCDKSRGLIFDVTHRVFLCLFCNKPSRVSESNIEDHLRCKDHVNRALILGSAFGFKVESLAETRNYINNLKLRASTLFNSTIVDIQYVSFSSGVCLLPVYNGFYCRDCNWACKAVGTFRHHLTSSSKPHQLKGGVLKEKLKSSKQTIQLKMKYSPSDASKSFYPVILATKESSNANHIEIHYSRFLKHKEELFNNSRASSSTTGNRGIDPKLLGSNKFFQVAGFMDISDSCSNVDRFKLLEIVMKPDHDNFEENVIVSACKYYMGNINQLIGSSNNLLLGRIESPDAKCVEEMNGYFTPVITAATQYSLPFSHVILMFVRIESMMEVNSNIRNHFTSTAVCSRLQVYLEDSKLRRLVKQLLLTAAENNDDNSGKLKLLSKNITAIVIHLLNLHITLTDSFSRSIIHTFIVCKSLFVIHGKNDAEFRSVKHLTTICAALLFSMKGAVLDAIQDTNSFQLDASSYISLLGYNPHEVSSYAIVISICGMCKSLNSRDIKSTVSFGLNPTNGRIDPDIYCIRNSTIHFNDFVNSSNQLFTELKTALKACWFEYKIPFHLMDKVSDDVRCQSDGYSFIDHPKSDFVRTLKSKFSKYIVSIAFKCDDEGTPSPTGKLFEFLKVYKHTAHLLYANIHLHSGNPGRATEIFDLRLKNRFENGVLKMRSVFFLEVYQAILLIPDHNKRGDKTISRFLTGELADIFIGVTSILRPALEMVNYLLAQSTPLNPDNANVNAFIHYDFLYLDEKGFRLNAVDIRTLITTVLNKIYGVNFSFNDYRQLCSTITNRAMRFHNPKEFREVIEQILRLRHLQAGHGMMTVAIAYDINDQFTLSGIDSVTMAALFNWSLDWTKLLLCGKSPELPSMKSVAPLPLELSDSNSTIATQIECMKESISSMCNQIKEVKVEDAAYNPVIIASSCSSMTLETRRHGELLLMNLSKVLSAFRLCVRNPIANYRSIEQQRYLLTCDESRANIQDRIFISATGSGKGLGYPLCAFLERSNQKPSKVTVVITPLFVLGVEMEIKLSGIGLKVHFYRGYTRPDILNDIEIVIVTPEMYIGSAFIKYLSDLDAGGRLGTMWYEEASTLVTWRSIRPITSVVVEKLSQFANSSLWFVTATCPVAMEPILRKLIKIPDVQFIRSGTTNRPSIHYLKYLVPNDMFSILDTNMTTSSQYSGMLMHLIIQSLYSNVSSDAMCIESFRAIMYCSNTSDVENLQTWLKEKLERSVEVLMYHSKLSEESKRAEYNSWVSDSLMPKILVATSACAFGLDTVEVKVVISVGPSRGLMELNQISGRLSRSPGVKGFHILVSCAIDDSKRFNQFELEINNGSLLPLDPHSVESFLSYDLDQMKSYTTSSKDCLRQFHTQYCDGIVGRPCIGLYSMCSTCCQFIGLGDLVQYRDTLQDDLDKILFNILLLPLVDNEMVEVRDLHSLPLPRTSSTSNNDIESIFTLSSCASIPSSTTTTVPLFQSQDSSIVNSLPLPRTSSTSNNDIESIFTLSSCASIPSSTTTTVPLFQSQDSSIVNSNRNSRAISFRKRENSSIAFCRQLADKLMLLQNKCYTCFAFEGSSSLRDWHSRCPSFQAHFSNACFICGRKDHGYTKCTFAVLLLKGDAKDKSSLWLNGSKKYCYGCTCPKASNGVTFHSKSTDGSFSRGCFNVPRFVFQSLSNEIIYRTVKESFPELNQLAIPSQKFKVWLLSESSTHGLMNITILFSFIFDKVEYFRGLKNARIY